MHEGRGLDRELGALTPEEVLGQAAEILVDDRGELLARQAPAVGEPGQVAVPPLRIVPGRRVRAMRSGGSPDGAYEARITHLARAYETDTNNELGVRPARSVE